MNSTVHFNAARRPELDGLRGIAIMLVLVWHYAGFVVINNQSVASRYFSTATGFCWSGVDLFFVLSGYLIGGILIDNRDSPDYLSTFYIRRACRILPLYFLVLAGFAYCSSLQLPGSDWLFTDGMPTWSYATFTQNFVMADRNSFGAQYLGPSWSLAIEEQFYLFLPFLVRFVSPKKLPLFLLMFIALAPALRVILYHWFSARHILAPYVLTICRADALLIGVFCAWFVRRRKLAEVVKQRPRVGNFLLLALAVFVGMIGVNSQSYYSRGMIFIGFTLIATLYGSLLVCVTLREDGLFRTILSNKHVGAIGRMAFGLYLLHVPLVGALFAAIRHDKPKIQNIADLGVSAVALAATFTIAKLSWSFFEEPLIRLGKRFQYTISAAPLPQAGSIQPSLVDCGSGNQISNLI